MTSLQSLCVLRLSAIGDVCHAVAVVQAIQQQYPEAKITWVIGRVEAALLRGLPGIRFVIFDKKEGLSAYKKLRTELTETFDVLLHMQVALRANLAAACIRATRKIGFPWHLSKELHSLVVNERITLGQQPHVLEGFAGFANALKVPAFKPAWNIPITEADNLWLENTIPPEKPCLVVSPAASKAERNWLPERYAQVIDYACEKGFVTIICGGPTADEKALADNILHYCKNSTHTRESSHESIDTAIDTPANASTNMPINLVGQTSLTQLLAVLKHASVVLSPDSGPAHMATTQNTPVIGLYAHSNPTRTGPYLSQDYVVEVYYSALFERHGKTAAELPWGARVKGSALMARISVEQVITMFDRVCHEQKIL